MTTILRSPNLLRYLALGLALLGVLLADKGCGGIGERLGIPGA